jgi:hypothetical protein
LKENRGEYKFFYSEEEHGLGVLLKTTSTSGNKIFNKHLRRARYRSVVPRLKNAAIDKFPALYSSLRELRAKVRRKVA